MRKFGSFLPGENIRVPGQDKDQEALFQAAGSILTAEPRERKGIGMQKEKSLHAILKNYIDPDPSHQEVPVGKYIADICCEEEKAITEIQTAGFGSMRQKLTAFLPEYRVTIVHPIPHRKTVCWIDPETGEILAENKSNFIGSFYELFRELVRIEDLLTLPGLTIEALLLDLTEYRLQDGWGNQGKRGSHRFDRVPSCVADRLVLQKPEDYAVFLPASGLPNPFTAKDLENAVGIHRKAVQYSCVLKVLTALGVTRKVGLTSRRAYLYEIRIPNETGRDFCRHPAAAGTGKKRRKTKK